MKREMITNKRRETICQYLKRHGWYQHINNLWNHDEPGLRRVDGMGMFTREATELQRGRDRRGL